mgnify:CR=1 FL=1
MSAARKLEIVAPDPFALVRGIRRMRAAGFAVKVENGGLVVESTLELSEPQRAFIGFHKPALVALLEDAEALHRALVQAGPVGLNWREGTPADWDDTRLLVAGEVLYGDGRMVNVHGHRYAAGYAPAIEVGPEYPPADCVPETAPHAATDSPPADPLATRVAELIAQGWAPWNARARAEAETNRPKVSP